MHTGTDMAIHMKGIIMDSKFIRLVQSLDPLFPIGSYTLSNGMETYVQKNVVCSRDQLKEHLESYLYMLTFNDLAFAAKAYAGCDVRELDRICSALKAPFEIRSGQRRVQRALLYCNGTVHKRDGSGSVRGAGAVLLQYPVVHGQSCRQTGSAQAAGRAEGTV